MWNPHIIYNAMNITGDTDNYSYYSYNVKICYQESI